MAATTSASSSPTPSTCNFDSFANILACGSGGAGGTRYTVGSLLATIAVGSISFGAFTGGFILLRLRLSRIYRPRSYLVPERSRVPPPPGGLIGWLIPVFTTPNLTLIQKCGLDSYFFLRYLRMLLKIFLLMAVVIMPILLPINSTGNATDTTGLDLLSISNIGTEQRSRFWAHTILAIFAILWIFYVMYTELRGYVRVRQAYLTSPQHRIRASATTVLVTGIPRKWLTHAALMGLYDVFPGGIRNIWINRNFDDLSSKVSYRESVAKGLESAETNLIQLCRQKHKEAEKKKAKKEGKSKKNKKQAEAEENAAAERMAMSPGMSAGAQHDFPEAMQDILEAHEEQERLEKQRTNNPLGIVEQGLGVVGYGLGKFGKGIGRFGQKVAGDVDTGFHKFGDDFNRATDAANTAAGFTTDDSLFRDPVISPKNNPPSSPAKRAHESENAAIAEISKFSPTFQHARTFQPSPKSPHPFAFSPIDSVDPGRGSTQSERTLRRPSGELTHSSADTKPKASLQIEVPTSHKAPTRFWAKLWKSLHNNDRGLTLPSPEPHVLEDGEEFPLNAPSSDKDMSKSKVVEYFRFWRSDKNGDEEKDGATGEEYPPAFHKDLDEDQDGEPRWKRFIEPKDRETMRLPLFAPTWFPSIPFIGKNVDKIYHLRRELARLNLEIEADQNNVEKYPFMGSAFIQFNHQVAAHMCCQSLSHHIPLSMAPRLVEISPDDVIWDNMSVKWYERYIRFVVVLALSIALIILYAVPITFTSLLSQLSSLAGTVSWLHWFLQVPKWFQNVVTGFLPPLLVNLILMLIPIIFRLLIKQQGVYTGAQRELGVQNWFFAFTFIQVFLVVTVTGGLAAVFTAFAKIQQAPESIANTVGKSLPRASDYFFSYLTVQALSSSASDLFQLASLFQWFILAPLNDSTARAKWRRQTKLNYQKWDSFFPPFTNFAVIGIIYSIIAPLILVFLLFIFSLYWIAYRYNILYVYQFRNDTGGLLFPVAVNQLFVGVYFMEACLIGLFFTNTNSKGQIVAYPQAIVMFVMFALTALYQILLNHTFKPSLQYLPITLEDEAVIRDEEFARAQASRFGSDEEEETETESRDLQSSHSDRKSRLGDPTEEAVEEATDEGTPQHRQLTVPGAPAARRKSSASAVPPSSPGRWFDRSTSNSAFNTDRWKRVAPEAVARLRYLADGKPVRSTSAKRGGDGDPEAQREVGDVLFSGFADELEDLSPDERDLLVRYAFQHSALRARRPVVWIPRDQLGVSDDEIARAKAMSTVEVGVKDGKGDGKGVKETETKTNIWISNEGTALDGKGKVVFRKSPPDFSNVDLIVL